MANPLCHKTILITAGPTQEYLDPVRYLTNPSSGEMGLELAAAFKNEGARVLLVLGPTALVVPGGIRVFPITTAREMSARVKRHILRVDALLATAAVSDWRFGVTHGRKMKKRGRKNMTVKMVANPDILKEAGDWRKNRPTPLLVGFCLETDHVAREAKRKLREKNLDLIIGNTPGSFASRTIRPLWVEKGALVRPLPIMTKKRLAKKIARWVGERLCPTT